MEDFCCHLPFLSSLSRLSHWWWWGGSPKKWQALSRVPTRCPYYIVINGVITPLSRVMTYNLSYPFIFDHLHRGYFIPLIPGSSQLISHPHGHPWFPTTKWQVQSRTTCCRDIRTSWNGRGWATLRKPAQLLISRTCNTLFFTVVWTINNVSVFVCRVFCLSVTVCLNKEWDCCRDPIFVRSDEWYFFALLLSYAICWDNAAYTCTRKFRNRLLHLSSVFQCLIADFWEEVIGTYRHTPIMDALIYTYIYMYLSCIYMYIRIYNHSIPPVLPWFGVFCFFWTVLQVWENGRRACSDSADQRMRPPFHFLRKPRFSREFDDGIWDVTPTGCM